jgi:hypothetical protein
MLTTTATLPVQWSAIQKIAFRFFMLFFALYIIFNPNKIIPFMERLYYLYVQPLHILTSWLAKHVLHTAKPITNFTNGSGDTAYNYLIILLITIISVIGTIIWSVTGKSTHNYNKQLYWLSVVIRYYLAITMVTYSSGKLIKLQFHAPSLDRLTEPVGNMSPMGLAWTYMGYSTGYNYFAGFAELACGLLLFFRKTATLGAIIGTVVIGNIVALNYCFDVPVKLLSTSLALMCIFLLAKDAPRLINFFIRNKDIQQANLSPYRFKAAWKNTVLKIIKYALIIYIVAGDLAIAVKANNKHGDNAQKAPLYGIYNVQSFVINNDTLQPLTTDTTRWARLIINHKGSASVKLMNDSSKYYIFKPDTIKHTITVSTYADTLHKYFFTYTVPKPDIMLLKGKLDKDILTISFKKLNENSFLLLNRGFHWVNEYPFNR